MTPPSIHSKCYMDSGPKMVQINYKSSISSVLCENFAILPGISRMSACLDIQSRVLIGKSQSLYASKETSRPDMEVCGVVQVLNTAIISNSRQR